MRLPGSVRSQHKPLLALFVITVSGVILIHSLSDDPLRGFDHDTLILSEQLEGFDHDTLILFEQLEQEAVDRMVERKATQFKLPDVELVVVMPFSIEQLAKVQANPMLAKESQNHFISGCADAFAATSNIDLVFSVRNPRDYMSVRGELAALVEGPVALCFRAVYLTHADLNQIESNNYEVGPPIFFHNTLNSSWMLHASPSGRKYSHMLWMEPDMVPVQERWLELMYLEAQEMKAQGVWMRGSLQQHNRKLDSDVDKYHINGNALYAVNIPSFRTFLAQARASSPKDVTAFDYMIYNERTRDHALKTQMVSDKFQITASIQNHPADLCPGLPDFLRRHPATLLVHGNEVVQLVAGSKCCHTSGKFNLSHRLATSLSREYLCLKSATPLVYDVHGNTGNGYNIKAEPELERSSSSRIPIRVPFFRLK